MLSITIIMSGVPGGLLVASRLHVTTADAGGLGYLLAAVIAGALVGAAWGLLQWLSHRIRQWLQGRRVTPDEQSDT